MERLRCHGVTLEIPPGLSDAARLAFCEAFARETPEGLTPEEAALHVELFLATHAPPPTPPSDGGGAAGAPAAASATAPSPDDSLED